MFYRQSILALSRFYWIAPRQFQKFVRAGYLGVYRTIPALAIVATLSLGATAWAADTYYWGGGTSDISNDTPIPLETNNLSGTWANDTKNWADSPFSPNTYSAWQDGSIASFGYYASGSGPRVKLATDFTVGGMVFQANYFLDPTNVSTPVNLTVNGPLYVYGATSTSVSMSAGVQLAGSSTLWKRGAGEFAVRGNSSAFTGDVLISEGSIFVDNTGGSGVLTGVTDLAVAGSLVGKTLSSAAAPFLNWRFNASTNLSTDLAITLSGGGAFRPNSQATGVSHTLGKIILEGAGLLSEQNASANAVTITLGDATQGLTQGLDGRGTLHVRPYDAAGTMKTTYKVATLGSLSADTLLPWVTTSRAEFMKLDSATGNALTTISATDANNDAANWAGLYDSTSNIRVTDTTLSNSLTGATTINSLGLNAASTLNLGGNTLNVASGGVAIQSASGTVLITNGTLTTGADVLYLGSGTDNAANFQARVDAVISGDFDVVKSGFAALYFQGSDSNTYTGDTYVNYGSLYLEKTGTAVAVPGDLVVRDGAAVYVRATANQTSSQLGASSSVTLGNSYVNIAANALMAVGGKLTLNNSFVEVIYNNTATNMLRLTGAGTGFEFNGGVVQHNATIDGTMSILTDVSYGAASTTQARFETMATNGSKLNVALNWGGDSGTATRTFDIADSGTLAAGQAEMRVDASLVNGGSGTTAGALRKTGSGVLQLVASNSYTGGTTVEAGTLQISTLSSAAQSNLSGVVSGSTLTFLEPIAGDFVPGQILNFNGTERAIVAVVDDYRVVVGSNPTAGLYSNTITSSNFTRTGSIAGNVSIDGGTLRIDNAENTVGGNLTFGGGALEVGEGNTTDYASKIVNSTGAIHVRTTTNSQNVTLGAVDASNTGGLRKTGQGTLTLSATNAYTGDTSVEEGKLVVNGSIASSAVTVVTNAGTIGGSGSVGDLIIADGGTLAPGNSPGTLFASSATWTNGGSYDWEILSLVDDPGTSWDLLSITNSGTLNLSGLTAGQFTINLITLSDATTQGALDGFSPTATYTNWLIASASDITGFEAGDFALDASLFVGQSGVFGVEQRAITGGQGLFLTYTGGAEPIPEPGTWAAAALLAATAGFMRWRRRR